MIAWLVQKATGFVKIVQGLIAAIIRPIADSETAIKVQNAAGTADVVTIDTINSKLTAPTIVGSAKIVTPLIVPADVATPLVVQRANGIRDIITITPPADPTGGGYEKIRVRGDIELGWPDKQWYSKVTQTCGGDTEADYDSKNELLSSNGTCHLDLKQYRGRPYYTESKLGAGNVCSSLELNNYSDTNENALLFYVNPTWLNLSLNHKDTKNSKYLYYDFYTSSETGMYLSWIRNPATLDMLEIFRNHNTNLWFRGLFRGSDDYTIKNAVLSLVSLLIESATNFVQAVTGLKTPVIRPIADGKTAIQIQNAAGSVTVLTMDTTNNKVTVATLVASAAVTAPTVTASAKVITPVIAPVADSETALKIQNAVGTTDIVTIDTSNNKATFAGSVVLSLAEYADDTAAAAGGVAVGGLYRTGNVVKIRIA
jgi:hypothetical protein